MRVVHCFLLISAVVCLFATRVSSSSAQGVPSSPAVQKSEAKEIPEAAAPEPVKSSSSVDDTAPKAAVDGSAPSAATASEANASYSESSEDMNDTIMTESRVNGVGREKSIVEEWEKHMQNFVPEMLVTFPLNARSDEYFYEDVGAEPVMIRGGYFVSADEEQSDVDFQITDPSGDIIFKRTQSEGLFHFTTKMAGSYSFIVSNHRWLQTKVVTFAVGIGNDTTLHPTHLSTLEQHLQSIDRNLRDIQSESTYLWIRQRSHMKAVQATNSKVFWLSLIEFITLISTSAFQVYYIKSLLSDRRIL